MQGQAAGGGVRRPEPPAAREERNRRDRRLVVMAAIGLVLVVFWLLPLGGEAPPDAADEGPVTTLAPAVSPQVTAPEQLTPPPAAGSVALQPGPYDARVAVTGLRFARTPLTGVTGTARLLGDAQGTATIGLRVDFYDASGARVGHAVQVLRQPAAFARDPAGGRRPLPFAITARDPLPGAIAARVAVTTLAVS